jgi:Tfp pilus assembly protein PilV
LEILVSAILLALVLVGLANIFVAAKSYVFHARARVTAAEQVKSCLEPLQAEVDQTKYTPDPLDPNLWLWYPTTLAPWTDSSTQTTYRPNYQITPLDLDTDPDTRTSEVNRVNVTISWDERTAQ